MNMTHSACLLPVQTIHTCRACFCFKKAGGQVQKKNHPLFHPPRPVSHPWGGGVSGELERRARAAISIHIIESKWFETYMTHSASLLPVQTIHTCRACFCPERQEAKFKEISPLFHPPDFDQTWRPSGIAPIHSFTSESGDD